MKFLIWFFVFSVNICLNLAGMLFICRFFKIFIKFPLNSYFLFNKEIFRSTSDINVGRITSIDCGRNYSNIIIISKVINSNLPKIKCDFESLNESCINENQQIVMDKCNGIEGCIFSIPNPKNETAQVRILYSCIPSMYIYFYCSIHRIF